MDQIGSHSHLVLALFKSVLCGWFPRDFLTKIYCCVVLYIQATYSAQHSFPALIIVMKLGALCKSFMFISCNKFPIYSCLHSTGEVWKFLPLYSFKWLLDELWDRMFLHKLWLTYVFLQLSDLILFYKCSDIHLFVKYVTSFGRQLQPLSGISDSITGKLRKRLFLYISVQPE